MSAPSACFLVRYQAHGIEHVRTVEACCEGAAVEVVKYFIEGGHDWRVRQINNESETIDIGGGAAVCPLGGRHDMA